MGHHPYLLSLFSFLFLPDFERPDDELLRRFRGAVGVLDGDGGVVEADGEALGGLRRHHHEALRRRGLGATGEARSTTSGRSIGIVPTMPEDPWRTRVRGTPFKVV